jgi:MoxR-like ATPase
MSNSASKLKSLTANIETIIRGKPQEVKYVVTALLSRGHILLEDNPGAGKTVLAKTLAQSISEGAIDFHTANGGVAFKRIQFTPDLWHNLFQKERLIFIQLTVVLPSNGFNLPPIFCRWT